MSELTPEIAADVVAASQAGAEEAAGALSRALDREFTLEVGESITFDPAAPPEGFGGPSLAVLMAFEGEGAVAMLAESSGLTPDWAPAPDPTGESKLATLAQELSMLLVPETLMADVFEASWVTDAGEALGRGGLADGAAAVPITLKSGDDQGVLWLVWPLSSPGEVLKGGAAGEEAAPEQADDQASDEAGKEGSAAPSEPTPASGAAGEPVRPRIFDFSQLPPYSKSLLKVRVPLMVTLAEKRQTVHEIMALGPGSILSFEKPCDAPIEISIGGQPIATGETVKVGEKFGVKISQMILPAEDFKPILPRQAG
ncbi:Flagellar motor switch protein FliN [Posidoniimonas polymericola]|uniref:Flagellar motor switch protein FliN n=1 Tax=Posidoniimonas polymericola TaxID=2528002 RepID=A0A5C5YSR3_9BACT|nr:FliM/FliN family flagellar motor switch protein [Posidoniimonas polymericola]TWT78044.1 Flagellar motor switch protein FliN [Posidoniimonas polymericola]